MSFIKMLLKRILMLLVLYQLCRLFFFIFNFHQFNNISGSGLIKILYGSLRFDMSTLMYLNSVYIAMFILPFNFRFNKTYQSIGKAIFIVANSMIIIANLADCAYYPFILHRTNAAFFIEFKNDTNLLYESGKFLLSYWYITLLTIATIWLLIKSYGWVRMPEKEDGKQNHLLNVAILPVLVIVWLGFARGSFVPSDRPVNISNAGDYVSNPNEINLVINTPFSIYSTMGNIKIPEVHYFASLEESEKFYTPVQSYPTHDSINRKNVVLIIVESLSREFVGSFNSDIKDYKGYTPFLDSLIKHSLTFKYGFANGRRSIEALPSVIGSIPSHTEAYVITPYATDKINTIGSVLKKHGYHTSFFHGAHEGSMGFSAFMKMAGFDYSFSKKDYNNDDDFDGTWGIYDEPFLQYWAKSLNTFPQPFCSAVFTVSSHHPFKLPEKYKNTFDKGTMPIHATVQYTDFALKEFFKTASAMPWYKNTVFVITADHTATYPYYQEYNNMRGAFTVPIIFYTPDSSLTGFRNELIQQGDIFPTIIDYLGFTDSIVAFGASRILSNDNHLVVNCYSGIYQAFYGDYMLQFDGKKSTALYKFKDDLKLERNMIAENAATVHLIEQKLKAYIQQYSTRIRDNKMVP